MPLYDFKCDNCGYVLEDEYVHHLEIDGYYTECPVCGIEMERLFTCSSKHQPFKEFTTDHLKHLTGGKSITFKSLQEIRKFEKAHEDRNLVWEPGSYDTKYGEE